MKKNTGHPSRRIRHNSPRGQIHTILRRRPEGHPNITLKAILIPGQWRRIPECRLRAVPSAAGTFIRRLSSPVLISCRQFLGLAPALWWRETVANPAEEIAERLSGGFGRESCAF